MLQALELEEFRALERQIIRETGPSLRASQTLRQSQSHLQRVGSSRTMLPRQQGAPQPATPADLPRYAGKQQPHGLGHGSSGSSVQPAQQGVRGSLRGKGQQGGQQDDVSAPSQPQASIWQQARQAAAGAQGLGHDEYAWEAVSQAESQDAADSTAGRQQQPADRTWVGAALRHSSSLCLWPAGCKGF